MKRSALLLATLAATGLVLLGAGCSPSGTSANDVKRVSPEEYKRLVAEDMKQARDKYPSKPAPGAAAAPASVPTAPAGQPPGYAPGAAGPAAIGAPSNN